jgi:hypothetical protein
MRLNKLHVSKKATWHEQETTQNDWTDRNLFTASGDTLCFIFESKRFPTPDINAAPIGLGKFILPLQILDGLNRFS